MMQTRKKLITPILMISSILLLITLQVFWLRGAYRNAEADLRKETNQLFRTTVFALHDSLIQKNIEPLSASDTFNFVHRKTYSMHDSLNISGPPIPDSLLKLGAINIVKLQDRSTRIEIVSSGNQADSLKGVIRPLMRRIHTIKEPMTFVLRLGDDSLKTDTIKTYFQKALMESGIHTDFKIHTFNSARIRVVDLPTDNIKADFVSDIVPLSPVNRYAVSFTGTNKYLFKEIGPEILFSIVLTLMTCAAFFVLYKNLRSQENLMKMKNDFISNITHELKTPVATVSVALEALKNFNALDDPKRTVEYLDIAQNELNRLTLMTDKILKTAVYEDKGVDLKLESFDLDALIQQVLASMKLVFEKRKTLLSYTKQGIDFTIKASQGHITNVLYNLVDNALKYSPPESEVKVELKTSETDIELIVSDNGVGIPVEYQKKIFEKFFRVPTGDVHNTKGYGLGLSYVASVIQGHGGLIDVQSEAGKGSIFTIKLPRIISEKSVSL